MHICWPFIQTEARAASSPDLFWRSQRRSDCCGWQGHKTSFLPQFPSLIIGWDVCAVRAHQRRPGHAGRFRGKLMFNQDKPWKHLALLTKQKGKFHYLFQFGCHSKFFLFLLKTWFITTFVSYFLRSRASLRPMFHLTFYRSWWPSSCTSRQWSEADPDRCCKDHKTKQKYISWNHNIQSVSKICFCATVWHTADYNNTIKTLSAERIKASKQRSSQKSTSRVHQKA